MNENRVIDERREPDSPTVARLNKRARRTLAEGVPYLAGPLVGACAWAKYVLTVAQRYDSKGLFSSERMMHRAAQWFDT